MDFSCNYGLLIWGSPSQTDTISTLSLGEQPRLSLEQGIGLGERLFWRGCLLLPALPLSNLLGAWFLQMKKCVPPLSCWKTPTQRPCLNMSYLGPELLWTSLWHSIVFLPTTHPGKLAQNGSSSVFFCPFFPALPLLSVNLVWSLGDTLSSVSAEEDCKFSGCFLPICICIYFFPFSFFSS